MDVRGCSLFTAPRCLLSAARCRYPSPVTTTQILLLVGVFLVMDTVIVGAIISAIVSSSFGVLSKKYPAVPMLPGAVYREFQDAAFGSSNFGKCVHIGVDENGLHLFPSAIIRWAGGKPATIPWTMVELVPDTKNRRLVKCTLAGIKSRLPAWCFDVQTPATSGAATQSPRA